MRNVRIAAAFALLALAGCSGNAADNPPLGQSTSTAAGTTTGSPGTSTTLSPSGEPQPTLPPPQTSAAPLDGPTEIAPTQVDSGALGHQEQVWTSADGRTVRINGSEGGCDRVRAEIAAQSGDQVLITLVTTKYTAADKTICTADIRSVPLNVTLDAPLGSRRIVLEVREEAA